MYLPTNGSSTKAGKVRPQMPKIGCSSSKSLVPRVGNWKNHMRVIVNVLKNRFNK